MKHKPRKSGETKLKSFDLPDTVDLASVDAAEIELIRLASDRRIGPVQAFYFSRMLEHRRRSIGDRTLEELMRKIDDRQKPKRGKS